MKIKIDAAAVDRLMGAAAKAAHGTIEALKTEVMAAQVMPFDTGDMQNNQTDTDLQVDGNQIRAHLTTGSPQARRLYYHPEYHFQKTENPNARGEWYEDWISGKKSEYCQKAYKQIYRRIAGL